MNAIHLADPKEVEESVARMNISATNFGKSRGTVDGGIRWVKIHDLQSDAGKKLNGKIGLVLEEGPNKEGRFKVQVDGVRDVKCIKPDNITDIPDDQLVRTYRIP